VRARVSCGTSGRLTPTTAHGVAGTLTPVSDASDRVVASNRRARRNYDLLDTWEAGLVLKGSEVKSLRESKVQISEAFAREETGELWLVGLHIAPYAMSGGEAMGHDPDRPKKLLLHRREIHRITDRMQREGLTLIPLSLYFSGGRAKVEVALAKGRDMHDKRQALVRREADREAERAMARRRRR
jgi:SsrA-binding protein